MTLIAGLLATDGVVIAADSQATDLEAQIRVSTPTKLHEIGHRIVWGLSGGVGLTQHVDPALAAAYRGNWHEKPLMDVRKTIGETIANVRRELVAKQLVSDKLPSSEVLVAGCTTNAGGSKPWLLEYPSDNMSQEHFKFCAIGSGKKAGFHAFESLRHYAPYDREVSLAKLFLYRIMIDAVRAESWGVGGDIHLWTITSEGAQESPNAEMQGLAQFLEQWKRNERESLRGLMMATPASLGDDEPATGESAPQVES